MLLWLIVAAQLGQRPAAPELPADVESRARSATVRVYNATQMTAANGVVVRQKRQSDFDILTVAHLAKPTDKLEVTFFPQGPGAKAHVANFVILVKATDPFAQDLAILHVRTRQELAIDALPVALPVGLNANKSFPAFSLAWNFLDIGAETQREKVVAAPSIAKKAGQKPVQFWKCESVPEQGRSGGPLIDNKGQLLGICSGGDGKAGYFTHCDEIREFLKNAKIEPIDPPKNDK